MTTHSIVTRMRKNVEILRKEPNKALSIADIRREGYMPWATHHRTIVGIIRADLHGPNLLRAKVSGEDTQLRYTVLAKNLINYLTAYGPALASMVRKPQENVGTRNKNSKPRRKRKA